MTKSLFAACFLICPVLHAQQDIPSLLTADQDVVPSAIRRARAEKFNTRAPFSMIEPAPDRLHPFERVTHEVQPELPLDAADTVVFGEVVNVQPFLSADGKALYTEYSVKVLNIAKSASAKLPSPSVGGNITIFRSAGVARLQDGKEVRHIIYGDPTPALHQKCLFFLTSEAKLDGYFYRKFWLVDGGKLVPRFADDIRRATESHVAGKAISAVLADIALQTKQ